MRTVQNRLGFLRFSWWLDGDGEHIWTRHDCNGKQVEAMLPNSWKADESGTTISPSFHCLICGTHTHGGGCRV